MTTDRDLLVIIPARGGSQRLKRKNIQPIDGTPLFLRAVEVAPKDAKIVVSTDDPTIRSMAHVHGIQVHVRSQVDPFQTITQMAEIVTRELKHYGPTLVIQPTVQALARGDIRRFLDDMYHVAKEVKFDGRPQDHYSHPVVACQEVGHTYWHRPHPGVFRERIHGEVFQELGVYYFPPKTAGMVPKYSYALDPGLTDIDYPDELLYVQNSKVRTILIEVAEPTKWTGSGHYRRMETLADALQHHRVIYTHDKPSHAKVDMFIRDALDSTAEDILAHPADNVVVFEDQGMGALLADLAINALLHPLWVETKNFKLREVNGSKWSIIRPEFLALPEYDISTRENRQVAIRFGGTDSKDLTDWAIDAVRKAKLIPLVIDPDMSVPATLLRSSMLISGGGQMVDEAAYVGIPNIVVAANMQEATHNHLGERHGNMHLGMVGKVDTDDLVEAIKTVYKDQHLRAEMTRISKARVDGKGLERVVFEIERLLRGL